MAIGLGSNPGAVITSTVAFLVAAAFALIVARAGPNSRLNRRLAFLLAADAVFSLFNLAGEFRSASAVDGFRIATGCAVGLEALAQLAFIATLDTPVARPFQGRRGMTTLAAIGLFCLALILVGYAKGASIFGFGNIDGPGWFLLMFTSIITLVASIDAFRRTERGSIGHRRSTAAMHAFVARDSILVLLVVLWPIGDINKLPAVKQWAEALGGVGLTLFVVLLAYGILKTQLYDIDLKVRWGIQKGTIVGVIVAVAFVGEKLAENFLNAQFGWIIGSILAGLLVFAAPRLNRLGDKVATTAMPAVEPTPAYVAHKKMEVYKAAVEAALEDDSVIDPKERALLDRLRAKLGLTPHDAQAIEAEVIPTGAAQGA